MPDPKLAISLLTPDEAPLYMRIRHEAFRADVNKILYFHKPDPSQATLDQVTESIRDDMINKGVLFLKCVDTGTGEMIAGARWTHYRPRDPNAKERTWEEVEEEFRIPEPYTEGHPEVNEALFSLLGAKKKEHMGTKVYYKLDTLVTHSSHHRRGAGGLLLKWGCDRADEDGVEAYLEASEMGAPLYARYGFESIEKISLDLRRWGGKEEIGWTVSLDQYLASVHGLTGERS